MAFYDYFLFPFTCYNSGVEESWYLKLKHENSEASDVQLLTKAKLIEFNDINYEYDEYKLTCTVPRLSLVLQDAYSDSTYLSIYKFIIEQFGDFDDVESDIIYLEIYKTDTLIYDFKLDPSRISFNTGDYKLKLDFILNVKLFSDYKLVDNPLSLDAYVFSPLYPQYDYYLMNAIRSMFSLIDVTIEEANALFSPLPEFGAWEYNDDDELVFVWHDIEDVYINNYQDPARDELGAADILRNGGEGESDNFKTLQDFVHELSKCFNLMFYIDETKKGYVINRLRYYLGGMAITPISDSNILDVINIQDSHSYKGIGATTDMFDGKIWDYNTSALIDHYYRTEKKYENSTLRRDRQTVSGQQRLYGSRYMATYRGKKEHQFQSDYIPLLSYGVGSDPTAEGDVKSDFFFIGVRIVDPISGEEAKCAFNSARIQKGGLGSYKTFSYPANYWGAVEQYFNKNRSSSATLKLKGIDYQMDKFYSVRPKFINGTYVDMYFFPRKIKKHITDYTTEITGVLVLKDSLI